MELLGVERNYASLSIRDLLEARDLYHYHLIHKANVVGTAIGLYLIRKTDPWPDKDRSARQRTAKGPKGERTLYNSEARDYSWPCVQVFVHEWIDEDRFGTSAGELHPESMVPKTLYMPDGHARCPCAWSRYRRPRLRPTRCPIGNGRSRASVAVFRSSRRRRASSGWQALAAS